ncbi:TIGR03668 family PPOX class F420-dependent oxidoreductase [Actinomadura atramentaria]|uniref:TIGR03668 family PPOX class F420-dependent oxidoreductase n=1 Tax=Actinomadura atramentaria TaxID=1990 RepID=UPI00036DE002|nr:TIGR03668 family PPOX class F420-dependent oxidoreductase [Actinomadura atramentaria]
MPALSTDDARARFAAAPVVRLATVGEDGRPRIVPVVFALRRDVLVTAVDHKPKRTRELRRLADVRANPRVSLLADRYDDDWERLWWVRADGAARVVTEPAATAEPLRLLAERYPQYRDRPPEGPVIAVTVESWTGWAAS